MDLINEAGRIAGSVTAVLALISLIFFTPVKNRIHRRKKKREEEISERKKFQCEVTTSLDRINRSLDSLIDDVGDLQYERLSQAQDFYMSRGWCTGAKKEMLCKMHKSYRNKGRNHLSEHYEEEIMRLPDKPPDQKRYGDAL